MDPDAQRYDRQLRLWGDHGQKALQDSSVCLINGSATGTELLKNLILPGIGSFVVVDGQQVTGANAGSNFFLDQSCLSKSRAQCVTEMLQELNPNVVGDYIAQDPDELLSIRPAFFSSFSLIVATDISLSTLKQLVAELEGSKTPLIVAMAYGMVGYLHLISYTHTVTESKPDNPVQDLRLDVPFPELAEYAMSFDLDTMPDSEHRLVPWMVIMLKALDCWKSQHGGQMPQPQRDRNEFKQLLRNGRRDGPCKPKYTEENFDEAEANLTKVYMPTKVPDRVKTILDMPEVDQLSGKEPFWIMARALRDFVTHDKKGLLPLTGSLPDMYSDSAYYIKLQQIFTNKAQADADVVYGHVQRLLAELGLPPHTVGEADVKLFCRNAHNLRVVPLQPTFAEATRHGVAAQSIGQLLREGNHTVNWYILLRAALEFSSTWHHYPGSGHGDVSGDAVLLSKAAQQLLADMGVEHTVPEEYVEEMVRYGGGELQAVAACVGGMGAQEAIKLLTHQFVPLNNTLVYNGIDNSSLVLQT